MKITTKSGYKLEFDETVLEDWDTMEVVARADSDNKSEKIKGILELSRILLGAELDSYMKYISDKHNGHKPVGVITEDLMGILEARNQGNSSSSEG